ncbi:sigma-70 family RNA polymerase sigma factor [Chitinivibrio alkaliphilus]|uniref:RNA polymerase, sigma 32 subunit, RpoD n=1 Tax=Chitinivibrio alkaliphilus ACht1 TaxID=1313304 RepID=U7D8Z9_9BACT|nr:RNA polymerase sigma factor RpoD/SigA [Chitinivibrio alkaliphilus]ERP32061.1 RNA polymerase, sigma 32 subunit, RpoD [Chitinivibrio alkaliphilus ACht1]
MQQSRAESLYFRDINKYDLLSDEEELEVIERVQKGDKKAADTLITSNLRFVVSVARKYRGRGLSYLELINEGNLGLLKAAQRYDKEKKVKFISYAVWWVRQSIQKAVFEQTSSVRIPMNKITLVNKFKKALEANDGDFDKTINQEEFRGSKIDILDVLEKSVEISLDTPIGNSPDDDGGRSLLDIINEPATQEDESAMRELTGIINKAMMRLNSREEKIVRMYYGVNFSKSFTLEEIGEELNLTRERVRLIRDRALRKLYKNPTVREEMNDYIDDKGM